MQANALARSFLLESKEGAYFELLDSLHGEAFLKELDFESRDRLTAEEFNREILEYRGYCSYQTFLRAFTQWQLRFQDREDPEPVDPTASAAVTRVKQDRQKARAAALEAQMKEEAARVQAAFNRMFETRFRWLPSPSDARNPSHATELRTLQAIELPKCFVILHKVLLTSGQFGKLFLNSS